MRFTVLQLDCHLRRNVRRIIWDFLRMPYLSGAVWISFPYQIIVRLKDYGLGNNNYKSCNFFVPFLLYY